jgi:hypothetical protein
MYGVDLLLPSTDAGARKTNKGVGNDLLDEIAKVLVEEEVPLFVCAVGVPPLFFVEKLHAAGATEPRAAGSLSADPHRHVPSNHSY